jgi:CO/xanthine dehydrogenase Mo-binding subunit
VLPAYFDPEESMRAETNLIHDNKPHNLEKDYHHVFGDPEKGFADADCVAEARFIAGEVTTQPWSRTPPWPVLRSIRRRESRAASSSGHSTQVPYYLQHKLSLVLEMPMRRFA